MAKLTKLRPFSSQNSSFGSPMFAEVKACGKLLDLKVERAPSFRSYISASSIRWGFNLFSLWAYFWSSRTRSRIWCAIKSLNSSSSPRSAQRHSAKSSGELFGLLMSHSTRSLSTTRPTLTFIFTIRICSNGTVTSFEELSPFSVALLKFWLFLAKFSFIKDWGT